MGLSKETVIDFIAGDKKATEKVYLEYKNLMFFIIASYVSNKADIDDILSESFIKAMESRNTIKNPENIKSFLSSIARNKALDFLKKNHPILCSDTIEELYGEEDRTNDYFSSIEPLLTSKETIIIYLKVAFSYTWDEIVEETGIPNSSARKIFSEAMDKLKAKTEKDPLEVFLKALENVKPQVQ